MPQQSNRRQTRIPLAVRIDSRDGTNTTDARLNNFYIETGADGKKRIVKRPGLVNWFSFTSALGRGIFRWEPTSTTIDCFYISGTTFGGVNTGVIGTVDGTLATDGTGGIYCFNVQKAGTNKLFFHNGKKGYVYDPTNGLVNITDSNFTSLSLVKGSAFLDGTMYVMDTTGTIWGSALGDATTWPVLNFIKAQIEPDAGVALAKQQSFIVAFKEWTTEFFYDNANPTGSPLSPYPGAKLDVGCANAASVQSIGNSLVFLGNSKTVDLGVYQIQNLTLTKLSTPFIDRILEANYSGFTAVTRSFQVYSNGHIFYVLLIGGDSSSSSGLPFVYDMTEGTWGFWGGVSQLAICSSTASDGLLTPAYSFAQGSFDGRIYSFSPLQYFDQLSTSTPIVCDVYTDSFDGDTRYKKYLSRMEFVGDQYQGSMLEIRTTDNDYKSYSNWRQVNLSLNRPFLMQCGTFRKRAWHIRHSANTPLRLEALELEMEIGSL